MDDWWKIALRYVKAVGFDPVAGVEPLPAGYIGLGVSFRLSDGWTLVRVVAGMVRVGAGMDGVQRYQIVHFRAVATDQTEFRSKWNT